MTIARASAAVGHKSLRCDGAANDCEEVQVTAPCAGEERGLQGAGPQTGHRRRPIDTTASAMMFLSITPLDCE